MKRRQPDATIVMTPDGRRVIHRPGPLRIGVSLDLGGTDATADRTSPAPAPDTPGPDPRGED